jgi:hypothetical protein
MSVAPQDAPIPLEGRDEWYQPETVGFAHNHFDRTTPAAANLLDLIQAVVLMVQRTKKSRSMAAYAYYCKALGHLDPSVHCSR